MFSTFHIRHVVYGKAHGTEAPLLYCPPLADIPRSLAVEANNALRTQDAKSAILYCLGWVGGHTKS